MRKLALAVVVTVTLLREVFAHLSFVFERVGAFGILPNLVPRIQIVVVQVLRVLVTVLIVSGVCAKRAFIVLSVQVKAILA